MADTDLTRSDVPGVPTGLILMLHGGKEQGLGPVTGRSGSWWRARGMMQQITARAHRAGVSVWLLRYRREGWNEGVQPEPSPVPDARRALERARGELPGVPVVLLGHSMGGRTAVAVADEPAVSGVVALAPWLPEGEPVAPLAGHHFAAAHGRADRITSAVRTEQFVRRAAAVAASAEFHDMGRVGHYLLRAVPRWNDFAIDRSLDFLRRSDDVPEG